MRWCPVVELRILRIHTTGYRLLSYACNKAVQVLVYLKVYLTRGSTKVVDTLVALCVCGAVCGVTGMPYPQHGVGHLGNSS